MARKKIEPIENLGNDVDKLTVQKSQPLFSLWRSELTLAEFKILDTYLSRIDSHKPEKRTVIFEKGELEKLLGVQRIRTEELDKRIEHLCTTIKIDDNTTKKGFTRISLFEKAVAEQDDFGLWQVELTCTQSAMKYVFNIENLGYLRYKLRCITSISSRHTYIMFMYLEANRWRKSWEVDLEELKKILKCETRESYQEYKRFNDLVLKKVQREMLEKTECKYTYEPVKKGRSVVAIRFIVETLPKEKIEDIDENQITIDDYLTAERETELWEDALKNFNFTQEQLAEIRDILILIPASKLPNLAHGDTKISWYHYLKTKANEINRREKTIKNKFSYLIKILKKDAEI
ncbi:MAG: replication initiation protein [Bacteroidales bacterium]|nr:replication initiation protein [Bacteroidales bacterium]